MRRNIPLSSLRMFEAAARHCSYLQAAAELHISGSAVSQQVSKLEQSLGVKLFVRQHKRLELTDAGRRFGEELSAIFRDLDRAINDVAPRSASRLVKVAAYQTMVSRWLIPRLPSLHAALPDISLEFETGMFRLDFKRSESDLGIRVGEEEIGSARSYVLFPEVLIPVCAPSVASRLTHIADLRNVALLHSLNRPDDWHRWLSAAGLDDIKGTNQLKFSNSSLAYEAASAGSGVALGQVNLMENDIQAGTLVAPFQIPVHTGRFYYLLEPEGVRHRPIVDAVKSWLLKEAANSVDLKAGQ